MIRMSIAAAAAILAVSGCSGTATTTSEAPPSVTTPSSQSAAPAEPTVAAEGDPDDPCTLVTADELNAVLGTSFEPSEPTPDDAREIVGCKYQSDDMTQIVDVSVSQTPGSEAFDTNWDLAPAYFDGKPKKIAIPGADQAYLVIADTYDAPVVGVLVGERFALLQVGVEGATPDQAEQLAATLASRL
ncbi:MAG: DUF3558 family protein [Candidatus Nanopelagicales bacterium]